MSINVEEKYKGRVRGRGHGAFAEIAYLAFGNSLSDDDDDAERAVIAASPIEYAGLPRQGIGLLEEVHTGDNEPHSVWEGTVRYGLDDRDIAMPEPGTASVSFRTTGGSQHFTHSRRTISSYGRAGDDYIDFKHAVGQAKDGSVQGYERPVSIFEWQETHTFSDEQMSLKYINTLYLLTDTTNQKTWRVFSDGDCLFLGAEGNQREDTQWDVTFHFAAAKTIYLKNIGDVISLDRSTGNKIKKRGWDLLWVYYEEYVSYLVGPNGTPTDEQKIVSVPRQVNIEEQFEPSDFLRLGIGT